MSILNTNSDHFHPFSSDVSTLENPDLFTFPFYYEPHPLAIQAAKELQNYLENQKDFEHNFGLDHCDNYNCLMYWSNSHLGKHDMCDDCRKKLLEKLD